MKAIYPGLILTGLTAAIAWCLNMVIPGIGGEALAILLGIMIANVIKPGKVFGGGITFSEKKILTWAIVMMGLNLNIRQSGQIGAGVSLIVLPAMAISITSGLLLSRFFGYNRRFGLLLGIGNAVCGSSAIAAAAPALEAEEDETGISIGVVNLLGTIGIFLLPMLTAALNLDKTQSSYIVGGVLQAVGQVAAAGFSMGDDIGNSAMLIKMIRVLMIGPVVMIISICLRNKNNGNGKRSLIPGYIFGFILMGIIGNIIPADAAAMGGLKLAGKIMLMVAMAAIGMKIKFSELVSNGPRALMLGCATTAIQTGIITAVVLTCM